MAEADAQDAFLGALRRLWEEVWAVADETQRETLLRLLAEPGDPVDVRADLADLVLDLEDRLGHDHPVIAALRGTVMYGMARQATLSGDVTRLREWALYRAGPVHEDPPVPPQDQPDDEDQPDDLQQRVEAALRAVPSFAAAEIPQTDQAGLILLPGAGTSGPRLPSFQFDLDRRPREVVVAVNEVLEAAEDPWGVACWWIYPHARLGTAPVDLLDRQEQQLLTAAHAVLEP
jgi:hypothetical protein